MLADLPVYAQDDSFIEALLTAVGREMDRLDDFLVGFRSASLPVEASGDYLSYWERFLDLPVAPEGVTDTARRSFISAAISRRTTGAGAGWYGLLSSILAPATFRHSENSDVSGAYAPYELSLSDITVQNRATTTVNGNQTGIPATNATLTVNSTTNFALSGTIFVGGTAVTFSGKTSTTFTGVDGLPSSVSNGTAIVQKADYRVGLFFDMARKINPAHIELTEVEAAGADTFRLGISTIGDEI